MNPTAAMLRERGFDNRRGSDDFRQVGVVNDLTPRPLDNYRPITLIPSAVGGVLAGRFVRAVLSAA